MSRQERILVRSLVALVASVLWPLGPCGPAALAADDAEDAEDGGAEPLVDEASAPEAEDDATDAFTDAVDDPEGGEGDAFGIADDLKPAALTEPNLITDGTQPVVVKDGDFSIVPPKGWKVYTEMPGLALYLEAPSSEPGGTAHLASIQVASFTGPEYIDDSVAADYNTLLVKRFATASKAIEAYRVRNSESIQMADGRAGLVFYSEFLYAGEPLMQMHVLVSSRDRHYLITYTDVAAHFAAEGDPFVAAVWDVVTSTKLGETPPGRNETLYVLLGAAALMVAFGAAAFGVNVWMSTKRVSEAPEDVVATELTEGSEERFPQSRVPVELSSLDDDDEGDGAPLSREESLDYANAPKRSA
jgi:hypothetical protein